MKETIKTKVDELVKIIDEFEDLINDLISGKYGEYTAMMAVQDQDTVMSINLMIFQLEYVTIMSRYDDFNDDIKEMRARSKTILEKITTHFHA